MYGSPIYTADSWSENELIFPLLSQPLKYSPEYDTETVLRQAIKTAKNFSMRLGITNDYVENPTYIWQNWNQVNHQEPFACPVFNEAGIWCQAYTILPDIQAALPVSFSQHPNYPNRLTCFFSQNGIWAFINSEILNNFSWDHVILTNDLSLIKKQQIMGPQNDLFLGCLWKEILPFLRIPAMGGKRVEILTVKDNSSSVYRKNVELSILLLEVLKKNGIEAECVFGQPDGNSLHVEIPEKSEGRLRLLCEANHLGVMIPELIQFGRYGAIAISQTSEIILGILSSGCYAVVCTHSRVDPLVMAVGIASGLILGKCFCDYWRVQHPFKTVLFIENADRGRMRKILKTMEVNLPLYAIPEDDTPDDILSGIVSETNAAVFVFAVQRKTVLGKYVQEACTWASKANITSFVVASPDATDDAIIKHCEAEFHVWEYPGTRRPYHYILEHRPLLQGECSFAAIEFIPDKSTWCHEEIDDEVMMEIPGRAYDRVPTERACDD